MMQNVIKIIGLFVVLIFFSCSEDTIDIQGLGSVTGTVVKIGTNEPLENVKISTSPTTSTVFTNAEGVYRINNVPSGDYTLTAEREGLLAEIESISVIADTELEIVFEMDVATAGNKPPDAAQLVTPADNATDIPIEVALVWSGSDPDEDTLTYSVSLRNDQNDEVEIFEDITDSTYTLSNLTYGTKYFWQVSSNDGVNDPVNSAIYAFETISIPNNRVVFVRLINGNSVIFSADDAGNEIQLTSENKNSFRPRRNETLGKIAFLRSVGSQTHIFVMNEDGSNITQVTSQVPVTGFNLEEIDFAWDSNGARLLFPNQDKLYSTNISGSGLVAIYQTSNGKLITDVAKNSATGLTALKVNNLNGYEVEIFTINTAGVIQDTVLSGVSGAAGSIDFSVDGMELLYNYDISEFENSAYRQLDSHLFVYDFATATATDISTDKPDGTNDLDGRFSPNNAEVIFTNTSNDGISRKFIIKMEISNNATRTTFVENGAMADWE